MKHRIFVSFAIGFAVAAVGIIGSARAKEGKAEPVPAGPAAFTDSSAAGLSATKRVAISSVLIQFQASTNAVGGSGSNWFKMFQSKATAESVLAWTDFSDRMQSDFADFAYEKLKADLTAAGYEVVPEEELKRNATYQTIVKEGGIPFHTKYANAMGDAYYVGPASLQPYLPTHLEAGSFLGGSGFLGWSSKFMAQSITPGGPSVTSIGDNWKIPGLETTLAKELNAHIVKATYVVTLGRTEAKRKRQLNIHSSSMLYGTSASETISATASAYAEPGLVADQTHISFRTPNGTGKWQKVSLMKPVPPKDGDVSVRLTMPMIGSTDYFDLSSDGGHSKQGFFDKALRIKFSFFATLKDPKGYQEEIGAMISASNQHMLALVKR